MGQVIPFPNHKIKPATVDHGYNGHKVTSINEATNEKELDQSMSRHPAGNHKHAQILKGTAKYHPKHLQLSKIVPAASPANEIVDVVYNVNKLDAVLVSLEGKLSLREMARLVEHVEKTLTVTANSLYSIGASDGFYAGIADENE